MKFFLQITFEAPSVHMAESFGKKALNEKLVAELVAAIDQTRHDTVAGGTITLGRFRVLSEEKEEKEDGKGRSNQESDTRAIPNYPG